MKDNWDVLRTYVSPTASDSKAFDPKTFSVPEMSPELFGGRQILPTDELAQKFIGESKKTLVSVDHMPSILT